MQVAHYCRVSGTGQEDNTSLANQNARCDDHSRRHGYEVVARERDIVSGKFILARSAFKRLLEMARRGEIQRIIVDIPDRLGRGVAIAVLAYKATELGAPIEYATEQPDERTLPGIVNMHAQALVSDVERHNIRRRMSQGRIAKAKSGRIIAGPRPKFGYQYKYTLGDRGQVLSCELVIDEAKIAIYRMVVGWVLDGIVDEGIAPMTIRQALKRLTALGIPTPSGNVQWRYQSLYKILTSPIYIGRWEYGRNVWELQDTERGAKSRIIGHRSDAETIVVPVPAAIDEATWQRLQARLKANKVDKFVSDAQAHYLARSICKCSNCGYTLVAEHRKSGNGARLTYYSCHHRRHNYINVCRAGSVRSEVIDDALWQGLCDLVLTDDNTRAAQRSRAQRARSADAYAEQIKGQQRVIAECKAELKQLARRQIGRVGRTSAEVYAELEAEINRRADAAQRMIDKLAAQAAEAARLAGEARAAADLKRELAAQMTPEAPFGARRAIVERLQTRCVWNHAERVLTVSCIVGNVALSL